MQQLQAAVALHNQGELDKAEEIYRLVLDVDVNNFYALNFCGCIQREKKRFDEGIDFLSRAVSLQPGNPDAVYNLGNVFKDAERWNEAISCYEKALGLRAEYPEALNNLGICLKEVERYEHSEIVLKRAVSIQPVFAGAWLNLGNTFKEQEKLGEAITSYRKAIEVKPDFAEVYLNLGYVLKEKGEIEEAIASYRKAIEVKPDYADAYLNLGYLLKEDMRVDELRQIVSALYRISPLNKISLVSFGDISLVFDWYYRQVSDLAWNADLLSSFSQNSSSCLSAVKQVDSSLLPPLFLGDEDFCEDGKLLYENGYLAEEGLVSPDLCKQFISQFKARVLMNVELIELLVANGVLRTVLERIFLHTGFPHLIWNCVYLTKGPDDQEVSDAWHYDNHYNICTPKLMIYLNSQLKECGATQFIDARLSRRVSEKSDYMGLVWQRESYVDLVQGLVKELNLDPVTLDPKHYTFSPEQAGSGVWFCPARSLHRGVSPQKGVRHVLSFSLTPLPGDCGWSVDQCVRKSVEILTDNINNGVHKSDTNPYWIRSEIGST